MALTTDPNKSWNLQQKKLLKKFSQLNEKDFHFDYAMKEVMMEKLHVKLGISREELTALLKEI